MCIRDRDNNAREVAARENIDIRLYRVIYQAIEDIEKAMKGLLAPEFKDCLLYTSDAADDLLCVDLGGRRIIKKKKQKEKR